MLLCSPIKAALRIVLLSVLSGVFVFQGVVAAHEASPEANKTIIQQIYDEVFNAGNLDVMDEIYAPDYMNYGYSADLTLEDFKSTIAAMRAALPDFAAQVEVLIAEADWAASRVVFSGTFENEWVMDDQTVAPNGESIAWSLNILHRLNEDHQVAEDFTAFDSLGLLTQLGVSPLPPLYAAMLPPQEHTAIVMGEGEPVSEDMLDIHKAAFTHVIEDSLNQGDLTAIDTYMTEDYATHEPFGNLTREQFKQVVTLFRTTVPDLVVTIEAVVAEGDWLAARLIYSGTFSNAIGSDDMTIAPTDKPIRFIINVFVHYNEAGIGIEDYKEYNRLAWLRQAELLPASS
jgi:predicted ester cyclase